MNPLLALLLVVLIAGTGFLLWNMVGPGAARKATMKRIERLRMRKIGVPKSMQDVSLRRKMEENKGLIYWITKPLPDFKRLGDQLVRAGKDITPKRYVLRRLLWAMGILLVSRVFGVHPAIGFALAVLLGVWLPLKWLNRTVNKQQKAFLQLFPDAIDLIVRGLRSGLPVSESLVLVSNEVAEPVGPIFANISNTMKLGVTLEKALQETARKLDMTEFNFFTTSIILQRETGGNLAEVLNNLSEVLRGRYIMRMKIKALSSEARASAMIISALPFVVILAVSVLSPGYMTPLWTDDRGMMCAGTAAFMMGFGIWTMNKMTKFEI